MLKPCTGKELNTKIIGRFLEKKNRGFYYTFKISTKKFNLLVTKLLSYQFVVTKWSLFRGYQIVGNQIVGNQIAGNQIVGNRIVSYQIGATKNPPDINTYITRA